MAKDRQGIVRGKCNTWQCECDEYVPPTQGGARCDYCDHTPTEHVRIIQLGKCLAPRGCECSEYLSEKRTEYTKCEYCDHDAALHQGAEKLRKAPKPESSLPAAMTTGGVRVPDPSQRVLATGPGNSRPSAPAAGTMCKKPGCKRPCYQEKNGRVHDFCGLTCRNAYRQLTVVSSVQSSVFQAPMTQPRVAPASSTYQGHVPVAPPKQICSTCGQSPAVDGDVCRLCANS